MSTGGIEAVRIQVMWNRLVSVVEEQAQTLIRTAFSTAVREAGDLSAGIFDTEGRMIAQALTGTPGHVNSMALSVGHFLRKFPIATLRPGDVLVTNDPWLGTGHLFDFTVVMPTFRDGQVVALFACTAHVVDIGGIGFGADGRQVYEEGVLVPIMHLFREGEPNAVLFELLEANVREPVQVRGDLYSLAACNEVGSKRLLSMMDEFGLDDLAALSAFIIDHSRQAMLDAIARVPAGTYRNTMTIDGYEAPVTIEAALTVGPDGIHVDYAGTSPVSGRGINVPFAYTLAYTAFGVRCLVGPEILNNAGSLAPVTISAPEGSIVHAPRPAAVSARQAVGQMLPDLVFGCLHQALASGAPAEGSGSLWSLPLFGGQDGPSAEGRAGTRFTVMGILAGGTGARPNSDGLSATAFPSRVRGIPVEIIETLAPVVFWRKELRPDSGGAGRYRGGLGQSLEVGVLEPVPFGFSSGTCDRLLHPGRGREGGQEGAPGHIALGSGEALPGKKRHVVPANGRLLLDLPGGGGYGNPRERAPEALESDVLNGYVSRIAARDEYGADGPAEPARPRLTTPNNEDLA